jgi:hypothetical protein
MHHDCTYHSSTIEGLLDQVHTGEIRVPYLHREYVWQANHIQDFFRELYRDHDRVKMPIGPFVLWRPECELERRGETIGTGAKTHAAQLMTVDCHQRLATLYSAMRAAPVMHLPWKEVTLRVAFRPRDGDFRIANAQTDADPEYIPDISVLWRGGASVPEITQTFLDRLEGDQKVSSRRGDRLSTAMIRLERLRNFHVPVWELGPSCSRREAGNIYFERNRRNTWR